jgi:hypothetical protein
MIRIDEIYYSVFVSSLRDRSDIICHWFDPFGSVLFEDMCLYPNTTWPEKISKRLIFWDQEPLHLEFALDFFNKFENLYHHEFAERIIIHSEAQSKNVEILKNTYGYKSDYYFFHGWAALDWYRGYNHSFLSQQWIDREFDHAFICPNNIVGGQRNHRLRLLSALGQRECINQNLISFPAICPYDGKSVEELFQSHSLPFPKNLSLPLIIDHDHNHASYSHRIDFWAQAMRCFCHVITETVYDDRRIHITEKTFKPIVLQQPFLMIGNRGSLKYLRDYGFQTFGNLWDESYDDLDEQHRISAVADICQDITSWSGSRMRQAQLEIAHVVQHNHDWFYGGFQDVLWKEIFQMINRWP